MVGTMPHCQMKEFMLEIGCVLSGGGYRSVAHKREHSMLDATACGLPLVVSDRIVYRDHVDGNTRVFRMNDLDVLIITLSELEPQELCEKLGSAGAAKMAEHSSWESVARRRFSDYQQALSPVIPKRSRVVGPTAGSPTKAG
jgi:glycosyltransferase involved in cell wall biosynthesis